MRVFGLIPAAGKSRRMGRPKLLLPIGAGSVIEQVLSALRGAGVAETLVVVAPDADELARLATAAGAHVLRLERDTPDMRATCELGLQWLDAHLHPEAGDAWLLLPADHPTIRPDVLSALIAAAEANPAKSIFVPAHRGRRGHPTLLRWPHAAAIRALPPDQPLNVFIRAHGQETLEIDWPSDEILRDLDTPEDYERLLKGHEP